MLYSYYVRHTTLIPVSHVIQRDPLCPMDTILVNYNFEMVFTVVKQRQNRQKCLLLHNIAQYIQNRMESCKLYFRGSHINSKIIRVVAMTR